MAGGLDQFGLFNARLSRVLTSFRKRSKMNRGMIIGLFNTLSLSQHLTFTLDSIWRDDSQKKFKKKH